MVLFTAHPAGRCRPRPGRGRATRVGAALRKSAPPARAGTGRWEAALGLAASLILSLSVFRGSTARPSLQGRIRDLVAPGSAPRAASVEREGTLRLPGNLPTVDPLIAGKEDPFFPSRARTEAALTPEMFTRAEACRECHAEIYAQWSGSIMSHAWDDPIYRAILERASVATDRAVDRFCIGCHSPIGLTTGTADAQEGDLGVECSGVSCDVCHTISRVTGVGNGAYVLTPVKFGRPVKYGPRDDSFSPFHDTTRSELHRRAEFCASCHNVTHPFNRLPVERTYDEWRDSPYNALGIGCQECHMTPGPGVATSPSHSAVDGKERPNVHSHFFTGANVTLHEHFGQHEMAAKAREMLRSAATIEFLDAPRQVAPGERATVRVKVTNVGAGHKLPTGFPEGREVWIHFRVQDADGSTLYELGAIEDGHTEEGTRSFKAVLGDPQGNAVDIEVWKADRILSDTRILPKGFAVEPYAFEVPADARGPLTLVADLEYASFPQALLDELLGKGVLEGKIVLMASARQKVDVGGSGPLAGQPASNEHK